MKIGILGGSFDPVHCGHLALAHESMKELGLDEVWFVPANINPHRMEAPPVSTLHRLNMLQLAVAPHPYFKLIDLECRRPAPSYTIETLKELMDSYPEDRFFLIIGDDVVNGLPRWKAIDEILNLTTICVFNREGSERGDNEISPEIKKKLHFLPVEIKGYSSTEVRRRLKEGEDCRNLLPEEVFDYIRENMLYLVA